MPTKKPYWDKLGKDEKKVRRSRRRSQSRFAVLFARWRAPIEPWPDPAAWGIEEEEQAKKVSWFRKIFRRKK
jgi:hypothetical protein